MNKSIQHRRAQIVFNLKEKEELSITEIALILDKSRQTIHSWMNGSAYKEIAKQK